MRVSDTLTLPPARRRAFDRLAADCARVLEQRFVALVAYGPVDSVVFATAVGAGDLDALGALAHTWRHEGLASPLLLTPDEFRRSLDAFPFEYQSILERHAVIAGRPPFEDVHVSPEDLRRACEIEAKGHLIHLRQGWLDAGGEADALAALLVRSAQPWRLVARRVAALDGTALADDDAIAGWASERTGLPADLGRALLDLDRAPELAVTIVRRLPELLSAAERLWRASDQWPRR